MASTPPPPLVGFNNNVRYRGMRFHIQTEDSGVTRPHIITHLFADGGYVIKSVRTDYSEYVSRPDRPAVIQRLMREQHRAMALDLRDGRLDATIDNLTLSSPPPSSKAASSSAPPATAVSRQAASADSADAPRSEAGGDAKSSRRKPNSSRAPAQGKQKRRQTPPSSASGGRKGRPSASAILQAKPTGESIFGALPQESLDDVILSYVTTTKNGPTTRRSK